MKTNWNIKYKRNKDKKLKGYVLLTTVVILSLVTTVIAVGMIRVNTEGLSNTATMTNSKTANYLAESCAEIAINKLKDNLAYAGNETITIGTDSCSILAVQGNGNTNRTIQTTATKGNAVRKQQVVVATLNPNISITSWRDMVDF